MNNEHTTEEAYFIGTPGTPWGEAEKNNWFAAQQVKRSYNGEVVSIIDAFRERFDVEQYGTLEYSSLGSENFPLFVVKSRDWQESRPLVLITGGVHGYETSGVHGALRFIEEHMEHYSKHFNLLVAPCLSPWGYETINRWNPKAVDPNRSFYKASPSAEAAHLMDYVQQIEKQMGATVFAHFDLHETTDTDNSEFRPALAARDAKPQSSWNIPDGFYTVAHTEKRALEFQLAVLASVANVTHIAPADESGGIIGSPAIAEGLIEYSATELGLCMGFTDAAYVTTTEVYPDSANATPEECILAQVAAVTGGLDYILDKLGNTVS